jgi:aryl-alcohol dehydrogenase-like predicted oxidoreductase
MYEKTGDRDIVDAVETVAKARNTSMAQVAMAWVLNKPVVTSPIVGVSNMNHLEDAIAAVDLELTAVEIEQLEAAYKPLHVSGF